MSGLSPLNARSFSDKYELPFALTRQAFSLLEEDRVVLLGVSGKMGSGKDTAAPLVLREFGEEHAHHEHYARPLKEEMTRIIEFVRDGNDEELVAHEISEKMNIDLPDAAFLVLTIWSDVKNGLIVNGYSRTAAGRTATQYLGTEIRRTQDDLYWVKKAMAALVPKLAAGTSIYLTDCRFPNEVDSIQEFAGRTLRLKVSPEVQRQRLLARDGSLPREEALQHISETALDEYEALNRFDFTINTDNYTPEEVALYSFAHLNHREVQR